jgi:hypothetical protein
MVDDPENDSDSDSEDEDEVIRKEADVTLNARLKDNTKDKYGRNIKKWEEFVQAKSMDIGHYGSTSRQSISWYND